MELRKKSEPIKVIQWNGNSNINKIEDFVGKKVTFELENNHFYNDRGMPTFNLLIETKNGIEKVKADDLILKQGNVISVCKSEDFNNLYEDYDPDRIALLQYNNLRGNYSKLVKEFLGEGYYNMANDVYTCDNITGEDIIDKFKNLKTNLKLQKVINLIFIIAICIGGVLYAIK